MGTPKITLAKFDAVKQMLDFGTYSKADIASKHKISVSSVFFINKYKDYKEYRAFTSRQHKKDPKPIFTFGYKYLITGKSPTGTVDMLRVPIAEDYEVHSFDPKVNEIEVKYTKQYNTDKIVLTWVFIFGLIGLLVLSFLI